MALEDPESLGAGGLSGKPLFDASLSTIKEIKKHSGDKLKIIAVGGIFTGSDAFEMLKAGADMIQVWTAFVYRGPFLIKKICHELVAEMKLNKISSIQEIRKNS